MLAVRAFLRLVIMPWIKAIQQAFALFRNPRLLQRIVVLNDQSNFLQSLIFFATAFVTAFAAIVAINLGTTYYLRLDGVYLQISYNDLAQRAIGLGVFIIFGFVNFAVLRILGERGLTLKIIWHVYSYVAGSIMIVGMLAVIGLGVITVVSLIVTDRPGEFDLYWPAITRISLSIFNVVIIISIFLHGFAIYTRCLNELMGIGIAKIIISIILSIAISFAILYVVVQSLH